MYRSALSSALFWCALLCSAPLRANVMLFDNNNKSNEKEKGKRRNDSNTWQSLVRIVTQMHLHVYVLRTHQQHQVDVLYDIEHCWNPTHSMYTLAANTHLHFMSVEKEDPYSGLGYRMWVRDRAIFWKNNNAYMYTICKPVQIEFVRKCNTLHDISSGCSMV